MEHRILTERVSEGMTLPYSPELAEKDRDVMQLITGWVATRETKNTFYIALREFVSAARIEAFNQGMEMGLGVQEELSKGA